MGWNELGLAMFYMFSPHFTSFTPFHPVSPRFTLFHLVFMLDFGSFRVILLEVGIGFCWSGVKWGEMGWNELGLAMFYMFSYVFTPFHPVSPCFISSSCNSILAASGLFCLRWVGIELKWGEMGWNGVKWAWVSYVLYVFTSFHLISPHFTTLVIHWNTLDHIDLASKYIGLASKYTGHTLEHIGPHWSSLQIHWNYTGTHCNFILPVR